MADYEMRQSVNILLMNLAKRCPAATVTVTALGPVRVVDGVASFGAATRTEVALKDFRAPEKLPPPDETVVEAIKVRDLVAHQRRSAATLKMLAKKRGERNG